MHRTHERLQDVPTRQAVRHSPSDAAALQSIGDCECNFRALRSLGSRYSPRTRRRDCQPRRPGRILFHLEALTPHSFGIQTSHTEETVIAAGWRERLEERAQRGHIRGGGGSKGKRRPSRSTMSKGRLSAFSAVCTFTIPQRRPLHPVRRLYSAARVGTFTNPEIFAMLRNISQLRSNTPFSPLRRRDDLESDCVISSRVVSRVRRPESNRIEQMGGCDAHRYPD